MFKMGKVLLSLLFLASIPLFSGCGEAAPSASDAVDIYRFPSTVAKVSKSDYKINLDGEDVTVNGPWFYLALAGYNGTDREMFIASMEVSCIDGAGNESLWTPTLADSAIGVGAALPNSNIVWGPYAISDTSISGFESLINFVGDLSEIGTLRYRCKVTLDGWFYALEDDPETPVDETTLPDENFTKEIRFTARYTD